MNLIKRDITESLMQTEFREILQKELTKRIQRNPRYSLRTFAKHLEVSPSALSLMMSGKRSITKRSVQSLGIRLGLSAKKIEILLISSGVEVNPKPNKFYSVQTNQMEVLSHWYTLSILELMKLKEFRPDEKYIANQFGISIFEAREAIRALQKAEILTVHEDGSWEDRSKGYTSSIPEKETTALAKALQSQFFEKATKAIIDVNYEKRDHTGMMMAISVEDVPLAKSIIKKFRRDMSNLLEKNSSADAVYHLAIGFFPLTTKK